MKKFIKKIIKFILFILILILIFTALIYFTRNIILTKVIEKSGSAAIGAKVDVYNLNLDIFKQNISIQSLEVADKKDPWVNIVETGLIEFGFSLMPLLDKKVIIDSMIVQGVQTGTKRETSGALPDKPKEKDDKPSWIKEYALKQLENEKNNIPVLNPEFFKESINVDKIAKDLELITPSKVKEVEVYFNQRKEFWNTHFKKRDYENRINQIKKDADKIKFNNDMPPHEIIENIEKVQRILDDLKTLKKEISYDRKLAKSDFNKIDEYKRQFPIWVKHDYAKAKDKISFEKNSLKNIGEMLFGKRITSLGLKVFESIDELRKKSEKTVKKVEEKVKESKERYPDLPKLWIKKINLSGDIKKYKFSGDLLNITTDQNKTGLPISFKSEGRNKSMGDFGIDGNIDFRGVKKDLKINLSLNRFKLDGFKVSSNDLFPIVIKNGLGDIDSVIISKEDSLKAEIDFNGDNLVFDKSDLKGKTDKISMIAKSVTDAIGVIEIGSSLNYEKSDFGFSIKSNLDSIVSAEISKVIESEVNRAKRRLAKIISEKLEKEEKGFLLKSGENKNFISNELNSTDMLLKSKEKEIKKIKKDFEKELKRAGENLLENLNLKF